MGPAAACLWLLVMYVLVATDDFEGFRFGEKKRLVQKKSQIPQHTVKESKLETIQKWEKYLRINEEMMAKGLLKNPAFDRHSACYSNFPQDAVNFSPRWPFQYDPTVVVEDKQEPSESDADLSPSETEIVKPRGTFTYRCPGLIECPDSGCCAIGKYCTAVNNIVGCCDLPMSVFPRRSSG